MAAVYIITQSGKILNWKAYTSDSDNLLADLTSLNIYLRLCALFRIWKAVKSDKLRQMFRFHEKLKISSFQSSFWSIHLRNAIEIRRGGEGDGKCIRAYKEMTREGEILRNLFRAGIISLNTTDINIKNSRIFILLDWREMWIGTKSRKWWGKCQRQFMKFWIMRVGFSFICFWNRILLSEDGYRWWMQAPR